MGAYTSSQRLLYKGRCENMYHELREIIDLSNFRSWRLVGVSTHPLLKSLWNMKEHYEFIPADLLENEKKELLLKKCTDKELSNEDKMCQELIEFRRHQFEEAAAEFKTYCKENNISEEFYNRYLRIINMDDRCTQIPNRENTLAFQPSFLYVLQNTPWISEVESISHLFYPFILGGETKNISIRDTEAFRFARYMLLKEDCIGILTHIKATKDCMQTLFADERISRKIKYIPLGVPKIEPQYICNSYQKDFGKKIRLFFSSSWHQGGFYNRGGLDTIMAFGKLCEKYDNLELVIKSRVPNENELPIEVQEVVKKYKEKIFVISEKLTDEEMNKLMQATDIFLLPSEAMHIISILHTMAQGIPIVAGDAFGIEEYVQDGVNGSVVRGRYGKDKVSWVDEVGMLREDYSLLNNVDIEFVDNFVKKIARVIEDKEYRYKTTKRAMEDHQTRFSLENWHNQCSNYFDECYRIIDERKKIDQENLIREKYMAK